MCAALFEELSEDVCENGADMGSTSSREMSDGFIDWFGVERTAERGACCLEDAVFSRVPDCVERGFMFVTRSL